MSDLRERIERLREEEREYAGDVSYEVWRNGGDPDSVDPDHTEHSFDRGLDVDECARHRGHYPRRGF